jgi:excinuclease ABC subunit C
MALVRVIEDIEVTVTNSETEALLLEYNLIKEHRPRYNVILRDDKSFPYLYLSDHEYPRLSFYRGTRKVPGRLFGPYPDARAARATLHQLHKLFRIRGCKDSYFENRSRPCLEHQIGRCSAPCVGLVSREAYARDVGAAIMVLEGRNEELARRLTAEMERAAADLAFERGARQPAGPAGRQLRGVSGGRGRRAGRGRQRSRMLRHAHVHTRRPHARHDPVLPALAGERAGRGPLGLHRPALP